MSYQAYHFIYDFHPVGQGLFASGSIRKNHEKEPFFKWVYDCGTSSSQKLIDSAIGHLNYSKPLDLVTISHFDHDHISGICKLIGKVKKINTLMLPYMTLEQRLWMAFEEDVGPNDDLMGFFLNPTEYLSRLEGASITNILYVPPSVNGRALEQTGEPSNESGPNQENSASMQIDFDEKRPSNDDPAAESTNSQPKVQFLKLGGAIRLQGFWEFVPYNDDPAKVISVRFSKNVQDQKEKLVGSSSHSDREDALKELKKLYDAQFGKSSKQRNIISLFLFAGPVYATWNKFCCINLHCFLQSMAPDPIWYRNHYRDYGLIPIKNLKLSILYTGDGYLENSSRLVRLTKFLGRYRVNPSSSLFYEKWSIFTHRQV